jgi:hypothetical protein
MHKIGHGTAKALEDKMTIERGTLGLSSGRTFSEAPNEQKLQTVLDLLELPRSTMRQALQAMAAYQSDTSSEEHCELLIQQCRGLDTSEVVDDHAGLPKTVSVENSFRRGTLQTEEAVKDAMEDLYQRLPLLLLDRASWAKEPKMSYPSKIRLTARFLDPQISTGKRRPSKVTSRQSPFDGQRYLVHETDLRIQSESIKKHIQPLLRELLPTKIDVTRINIAVTDFQDVAIAKVQESNVSLRASLDRSRAFLGTGTQVSHSQLTRGINTQVLATTPLNKRFEVPSTNPLSSKLSNLSSKRMKTTRIDQFFAAKK